MDIFCFQTLCGFIGFYHIFSLNHLIYKPKLTLICLTSPYVYDQSSYICLTSCSTIYFWRGSLSPSKKVSPICYSLSTLDLTNLKNFVFSINFDNLLFIPFFPSSLVHILESLGPNADVWRTRSNFFIVKTNGLFLPFVSSLFPTHGFMEGISFLPHVSLSYVSLSVFGSLERLWWELVEISWKSVCTYSAGQHVNMIVSSFGQFSTCATVTYLCKAYGFLANRLFHLCYFLFCWTLQSLPIFMVCYVRHKMLSGHFLLKEPYYSSFYPFSSSTWLQSDYVHWPCIYVQPSSLTGDLTRGNDLPGENLKQQ